MYNLEKKSGIELVWGYKKISETNSRKETKTISYEIFKERKEIRINVNSEEITLDYIFLLMELVRIKEDKELNRICVGNSIKAEFQIIKGLKTESGELKIINEEMVKRMYGFIEKLSNHPNVLKLYLDHTLEIKTKTTEFKIHSYKFSTRLDMFVLDKNGEKRIIFDTFENMEESILYRLKTFEMSEVFESLFAAKTEKFARHMVFPLSEGSKNKIYQHKNIERFEKEVSLEKHFFSIVECARKSYFIRYVIIKDFLFGFMTKDFFGDGNLEVIIEKVDGINEENKYEKIIEVIDQRIEILGNKNNISGF